MRRAAPGKRAAAQASMLKEPASCSTHQTEAKQPAPAAAPDAALAARLLKHCTNLQRQLTGGSHHQRNGLLACRERLGNREGGIEG